jgi:GNAT superfamily N-acetyltransferase
MICPKCGLHHVAGDAEEEVRHAQYCDLMVNGPPTTIAHDGRVIWTSGDEHIIVVTDQSSEQLRKLAHEVSRCANREMRYDGGIYRHFDPPDEREVHIFLFVRRERALGLCLFERRTTIWHCLWNEEETPTCVECPELSPMWSVCFVWVHKQCRGTGAAYTLLREAKALLKLNDNKFGWYTPFSEDGERFVRGLHPDGFYVAK